MKHNTYKLSIMLLLFTLIVKAQETVSISKIDVLNKVSKNNITIKISDEEFNKARADYRQTNAVFLPSITASHTGILTTNPLMVFGSKLNQEILTQNDFNPVLLNDPSQTQNFATKFEVQQPLINIDGMYQRKAAKSKMEAMSLQSQRTTDYLTFEVEKAYMQLQLTYKTVEVLKKALEAANENKRLADNSYRQGYLQRVDVLLAQVRVTDVKNQLHTAKSSVKNASDYLSFLMNEKGDVIYQPSDNLIENIIPLEDTYLVSKNRTDIKAMQFASKAYETINKADRMAFLPRLNAFGSYEMYDDNIFQGNASGYLIGTQLSWNLFDGSKRIGKAQKSKSEYEKSKLEYEQYLSQSQLELNKAMRLLKDAENKLQLTRLSLEQSEESLRIRTNRFREGLEKTSDLLMAETQYAQRQLEYYQTIFQFNYAHAYIQFLTKE